MAIMAEAIDTTNRMRSRDRILKLEIIDGKKPTSSTGLTDSRLFSGENKLHAVADPQTGLWTFKYEMGGVPPVLRCQFTSFKKLLEFASDYYIKRNIRITEVID